MKDAKNAKLVYMKAGTKCTRGGEKLRTMGTNPPERIVQTGAKGGKNVKNLVKGYCN